MRLNGKYEYIARNSLTSVYASFARSSNNTLRLGGPTCDQEFTLCLKKVPTFKLSVTLSNLNRFSKRFALVESV